MSTVFALLKQFGLSEKESQIYLSLLRSGPASVMELSNRLNLNRTSAHLLCEKLKEVGIVVELQVKAKRKLKGLSPESLMSILEREEQILKKKSLMMQPLIESIYRETSFIKEATETQVKYFTNIDSIDWLYDRILESKEVRTYVNAKEIIKVFPLNWERFMKRVVNGLKLWDFHHFDSFIEEPVKEFSRIYPNFQIKNLPLSVKFDSMDYLIYDGNVAIVYGFPNPHAVVIENRSFYEISRELFDFQWNLIN